MGRHLWVKQSNVQDVSHLPSDFQSQFLRNSCTNKTRQLSTCSNPGTKKECKMKNTNALCAICWNTDEWETDWRNRALQADHADWKKKKTCKTCRQEAVELILSSLPFWSNCSPSSHMVFHPRTHKELHSPLRGRRKIPWFMLKLICST